MRRAVPLLVLALLAVPSAAQDGKPLALLVEEDRWEVRVVDGLAQVDERLRTRGVAEALLVRVPADAADVQAFLVNGTATQPTPWRWVEPGLLAIGIGGDGSQPQSREVRLLYTFPVGPLGFAAALAPAVPTESLVAVLSVPEDWQVTADGDPAEPAGASWTRTWSDVGRSPHRIVAGPAAGPSPLAALGGLLLLMLGITLARAVTARGKPPKEEMGLLDHLRELQGRLKAVVLVVAVLMLALFTFALIPARLGGVEAAVPVPSLTDNVAAQTFRLVACQFVPEGVQLIVVDPISAALVQVEVALFLALLVASPFVAYQAGAFLMPALLPHERRLLLRAIPVATLLFVAGVAFAYLLMVPTMMRVLYSYAQGLGAAPLIAVDHLVSFAVVVTLLFGLAFELPVLMVALAKLGLASPRDMAAKWRHVVVGLFVLAAVITPDPSVVSQLLVAVPLLALYGVGLVAARALAPTPAAQAEGPAARAG